MMRALLTPVFIEWAKTDPLTQAEVLTCLFVLAAFWVVVGAQAVRDLVRQTVRG